MKRKKRTTADDLGDSLAEQLRQRKRDIKACDELLARLHRFQPGAGPTGSRLMRRPTPREQRVLRRQADIDRCREQVELDAYVRRLRAITDERVASVSSVSAQPRIRS